jgi:hypothetical protein
MGEGELTTVYRWKRLNGCTDNQYRDTDREGRNLEYIPQMRLINHSHSSIAMVRGLHTRDSAGIFILKSCSGWLGSFGRCKSHGVFYSYAP